MALDVFVMPLWRFKSGIFKSPIEEVLGIAPTTISLADPDLSSPRPPWYLRLLAWLGIITFIEPKSQPSAAERYENAVREVDALKMEMSRLTAQTIDWQDIGVQVYGEQFHGRDYLKAFAVWCDHRETLPEFAPVPPYPAKHPAYEQPLPERRRFPVLTGHSLYTGYFLPTSFEGTYKVEPFKAMGHWDMHHCAASTQTVICELIDLHHLAAELIVTGGSAEHLKHVGWAQDWAEILRKICELSVAHGVPVIFYG